MLGWEGSQGSDTLDKPGHKLSETSTSHHGWAMM